jgi:superfamily II DNA or RNA helicase
MKELESRCWTLAADRMVSEALASVLMHAEHSAARVIHDAGRDLRAPVEHFFTRNKNDRLRDFVSAHEWEAVASAFLTWAGATDEDEEGGFIASVDGHPEAPPFERAALREWIAQHDMVDHLADPLPRLAPLAPDFRSRDKALRSGRSTVSEALEGLLPGSLGESLKVAARSYLAWQLGRREREARRQTTWSRTPEHPSIKRAVEAARGVLEVLDAEEVPVVPVPAGHTTIALGSDGLSISMDFAHPYGLGGEGRVFVSFVERSGDRARSSLDDGKRSARHHDRLRVLTERALDVLLDDNDPFHQTVFEALSRPRWDRLLAELDAEVVPPPAPPRPFDEDERLVWRLDGAVLDAALQRKRKRSGWTGGRRVEISWLATRPGLEERDRRVIEAWLGARRWPRTAEEGDVLEALVGHPRVVTPDKSAQPLAVRRGAVGVCLVEKRGETWIRFRVGDEVLAPNELLARAASQRLGSQRLVVVPRLEHSEILVVVLPAEVSAMATVAARWETGIPAAADEAILRLLGRLPPHVGVELPTRLRGEPREPSLRPVLRLEPLPGGGLRVEIAMRPLPSGPAQPPGDGPRCLVGTEEGVRVHAVRDLAQERRAVERAVVALGLDAGTPDGAHVWRLDDPEAALDLVAFLRMNEDVAAVEWPEDVAPWRMVGQAGWANLKVRTKKLAEWFALSGEAELDEGKVALAQILAALRDGRRYVRLGKGRFARIEDDLRAQLAQAADVVFEEGGEVGVSGAALHTIEALVPVGSFEPDPEWTKLKAKLEASRALVPALPHGLSAELRGYQGEGIAWLQRVASWGDGACLADDMGLGKTLQALALILERAPLGPAIVVCPTSLSDNWRKECGRFTPSLTPRLYRGPDRAGTLEGLRAGEVVITSYDILLRDAEALEAIPFSTVVFDEAHALKNPDAQRTRAARRLDAGFTLGLTGTPLENHLGELWSLFSVLVPGLLGPWKHFRARFAIPIEREGKNERRVALRGLMSPFLLRRTKAQVAPELPPRVEVVRSVELTEDERALYEAERRSALEALAKRADDGKKRFAVLGALMRLRRLACHPQLVHPESLVASSKLDELVGLADDLVEEGHRTLVFSQFTSHLAIARRALLERGYTLLYLDGSTPAKERDVLVERWQAGRDPFFLISLKAGGTGLNLTAADTVVHLDPWWNPAAEDQASDRTHRIGQDKPVTVVRLVSQGTIEETVVALHEEKRELARGILEGAESNAKLDTDELIRLLAG